ncbi:hypothetical protein LTR85_000474 [Meristemomyces frigidus]|nr:hypothetical protein LTR85_000474 [Meristemomyces frigidus]
MRYCVTTQLHLLDREPQPSDVEGKVRIQMRRRVFWSAYALDRAVGTMFDLPFSIPDYQITVPIYANIEDDELPVRCREAMPADPASQAQHTSVSAALHVVYCRQIQSEILNITLHRDYAVQFERCYDWRLRILEKLDRWKSLCHRFSDTRSKSYTSNDWMHMIYNFSLAMLYHPTAQDAGGPAAEWTVKSCVQALLIFHKFQREGIISEPWMGLIQQFKCGVALLYCFFITPPHLRSETYNAPAVGEALGACRVTLALLAMRWAESESLRDTFDLLVQDISVSGHQSDPRVSQLRPASAEAIRSKLDELQAIVIHRGTLRMICEMAATFPHPAPATTNEGLSWDGAEVDAPRRASPSLHAGGLGDGASIKTADLFLPLTPRFIAPDIRNASTDFMESESLGFPGLFDADLLF